MNFKINEKRKKETIDFKILLPEIFNQFEDKDIVYIEMLKNSWNDICGNIIGSHSMPQKIFNTLLIVDVDHSAFANELSLMKDGIMDKIKNLFPYINIRNIKFETKKVKWN